jgi:enterochelin esterase family protein
MKPENPYFSPKLETLKLELEAGNSSALDLFWQELGQQGTPIIESIEDDETHSLVTFVWRSSDEDQEVGVVSTLSEEEDKPDVMARLPGTDLWHKSYRAHNEMRESYQFAVAGENVIDPFNPHQHVFPGDEEIGFSGWVSSVVEMPKAPPQPWSTARPDVPHGHVDLHRINSEILDKEYRVWVYTPPDYVTGGEPYGYLLIFDGWFYVEVVPTPTILDNLLADGLTPPLVAIMVGAFDETRQRDMGCYPPFVDFLTEELLPWARQTYHLSENPAQNAVSGSSRGGLMAAFTGLEHPEIFGNVLALSSVFGIRLDDEREEGWLIRQFVTTPRLPLNFYLEAGSLETEMDPEDYTSILVDNWYMRDVLQAKGYPVHYSEFYGGHNPMNWQGTMANAILALLGNEESKFNE